MKVTRQLIKDLLTTDAVYYITVLKLQDHFDVPNLIKQLTKYKDCDLPIIVKLIKDNTQYQKVKNN